MSWQSWTVGKDLRQQIQDSERKGAVYVAGVWHGRSLLTRFVTVELYAMQDVLLVSSLSDRTRRRTKYGSGAHCRQGTALVTPGAWLAIQQEAVSLKRRTKCRTCSRRCCVIMQELEGQVQGMHLPDNVEKAWKDVEHDLSENPVSKGVESLQKLTDPSVRALPMLLFQ